MFFLVWFFMEVRIPSSLIHCKLPKLVRSSDKYVLDKKVLDLSDLVKEEFREDNGHPPSNPSGRIHGWNGDYLSAVDWKRELGLRTVDFKKEIYVSRNNETELHVLPVRVSEDLASSHYYAATDGNQDANPIACLGSYIIPVVLDPSGKAVLLVATRPESAFFRPGRFDATGAAIPETSEGLNYVDVVAAKLLFKYGIKVDPVKVQSLGIITDNVVNYLIPSGFAFVREADVSSDCELKAIPIKEFKDFVNKQAPIENWNYPALMAMCETIYFVSCLMKDDDLKDDAMAIRLGQYYRLQQKPLQERSVLQNLGIMK